MVEYSIPSGLRLDRYIAEYMKILSRSQIKARKLEARLNGKTVKVSRILKGGENLELSWAEEECSFLIPENIPLDVIYEDKRVIVINKAQGMVVHPGAGNRQGTLANALLFRRLNRQLSNNGNSNSPIYDAVVNQSNGGIRPGIVHRLDKDTSGIIIAAWDDEAHAFLSDQFKARKVRKIYAALVQGYPREAQGCIDKRIVRSPRDRKTFTVSEKDGRRSITYYKLVKSYKNYSFLLLRPKTGRTHQIRVHLKHLGIPILGDSIYGREDAHFKKATLMLHALSLSLILPDQENMVTFKAELPLRFKEIIRALNK